MIELENTITIGCAREKVFAFITDPDNLQHWLSGLESFEIISGKVGEVGASAKQVLKQAGRRIEFVQRVDAVEHPSLFEVSLKSKDMEIKVAYTLEESEGETLFNVQEKIRLKSFFLRQFKKIVKSLNIERQRKDLERLKNVLESDLIDTSPT